MIKILIVEDDTNKLREITKALNEVDGIQKEHIISVTDLHSARQLIRTTFYDLLILDIAVPNRIDEKIAHDGGIRLLEEILERSNYMIPAHILGITAYPDIFVKAQKMFSLRLLTVIPYDQSSDEWKNSLQARTRHIVISKTSEKRSSDEYRSSLAVICALENPELASVTRIPWLWKQIYVENDDTIYYKGEYTKGEDKKTVYAAVASRMGITASAILSTKMILNFRPKYLAMTGITAGIPGKNNIGDIIIADPTWDWGSGKYIKKDDEISFMPAPHQLSLDPTLRGKIRRFISDHDILVKIKKDWPGDKPENELRVHLGPLASGAAVLADEVTAGKVKLQHRELLGIEMEAYGVFAAAEEFISPRPSVFIMKSVVDFADTQKDDRYQKYSAYTSAQAMRHFVELYL